MVQGYNELLRNTAPKPLDYYANKLYRTLEYGARQPKVNPTIIKNPNPSITTQVVRNVGQTGKGLSTGAKVLGTTAGKYATKAAPGVGAAISGYDAYRSFEIADQMDKINKMQPGRFKKEEIDYYRNKGKAIAASAVTGGIGGGVVGAGFFSVPTALAGTSLGGLVGDLGYKFANRNNPYKERKLTQEDMDLLNAYIEQYGGKKKKEDKDNKENNVTLSETGVPQFDIIDADGSGNGIVAPKGVAAQVGSVKPSVPVVNNKVVQQQAEASPNGMQAISNYVAQLQQVNRPYIDNLKKYYNNYANLLDQQQRAAGYWNGIAGLTGNKNWANMANYYNPVANEANKLSVLKQIQDAEAGDINAINELMGNLSMAQEMGLPPEAAFANKNLLTMMAAKDREANRYQIALENNLMKKYGIDRNYARALTVQAMRGQNALDVASMYSGAYGNGGGVAPGLNQRGTVGNVASMDAMLQAAHNKNNR